jgi:hypothetical protein
MLDEFENDLMGIRLVFEGVGFGFSIRVSCK